MYIKSVLDHKLPSMLVDTLTHVLKGEKLLLDPCLGSDTGGGVTMGSSTPTQEDAVSWSFQSMDDISLCSGDVSSIGDAWSLAERDEEDDYWSEWELEFESKSVIGNLLEEILALQEVCVHCFCLRWEKEFAHLFVQNEFILCLNRPVLSGYVIYV